ncbi:hypothetical protein FZI85_20955 [Mycobacterium sp. CBMA293]|uniref:hypothetical protein n=1 Tax=unclassified Mycolicibacterium TaxID=2636767 RepID=UPI0012DD78FD|nr:MULTISPECIES: hypothetical protein [unclassified Mycolicibacterium]MUL47158.1 hypothetical protein [Mycolicibacterium sp. CBMA 360]MUL61267.1 hypothetical protein [Mycolicibacterium sp. CBMA 335]MUL72002.1 hypothetical protein [Mycolicibacterium sp. CBMA 311]MUL96169.1 hypothetical protein [Mycolicibacterium sp. CBMA 230]MUM06699.1 hypothetical protein [Mycolicibacterium sp. CBMA 213]
MNESQLWEALKNEYSTATLGTLWLEEVSRIVRIVAPKYPPRVYSETGAWGQEEFENLTQDVVVQHLLDDGQLAYIMDTATELPVARKLLHRTVRRSLARGRRRTVVDNLLERCREFHTFARPDDPHPAASDDQLRLVATRIAKLPRIRIINSDRAPAVFSGETLKSAVDLAIEVLAFNIRERELARVLTLVLTDYLPGELVQHEGGIDEPGRALTPEEEIAVMDTMRQLMAAPPTDLQVLALKIADRSDADVARHLGVSRPTAAKRFREASAAVQRLLAESSARVQDEILHRFSEQLLNHHLPPMNPGDER